MQGSHLCLGEWQRWQPWGRLQLRRILIKVCTGIIAIKTTMIIMMLVISSMFTLSVSSASQQGAATWYGESCPSTLTSTFRWICIILKHIYSFQGQRFWHHNNLNHDHSFSALELTQIRKSPQQMSVVGALSATQVFKEFVCSECVGQ